MALVLIRSVGIRGDNLHPDVLKVQETINRVPENEGGSALPLKLDGLCGPKTKKAIQKFQLHHFGWRGADGLIEVGKQTHQKLNTYAEPKPTPTPKPPVPPRPKEPKAMRFVILREDKRDSFGGKDSDYFFEIRSVPFNFASVYYLTRTRNVIPRPIPLKFHGPCAIFNTRVPLDTRDFKCFAVYLSEEHQDRHIESQFILKLTSGTISIPMRCHLIGPHGLLPAAGPGDSVGMRTWQSGQMNLMT